MGAITLEGKSRTDNIDFDNGTYACIPDLTYNKPRLWGGWQQNEILWFTEIQGISY